MRKYIALDLEISTPIPEGATDWQLYRPFGVACVVTKGSDHQYPLMWFEPGFGLRMTAALFLQLAMYLDGMIRKGYTLLTFNGAGFDFNVLQEEYPGGAWGKLAPIHVDLFFHIFCAKGYCRGLDTLARGAGLTGKPEGVDGARAPQMWLDGRYHEVLDYCAADVEMTLGLAEAGEGQGCVRWLAKSGKEDGIDLVDGWLTVGQAMRLPEPDNSWMSNPWPRSKFIGWLK